MKISKKKVVENILEKHFVVVIREHRGYGKSYTSIYPKASLTIEQQSYFKLVIKMRYYNSIIE